MTLPAPKWLVWTYAIVFWVFVVAALVGDDRLSAVAYIGLKLMFFLLAVGWVLSVIWRTVAGIAGGGGKQPEPPRAAPTVRRTEYSDPKSRELWRRVVIVAIVGLAMALTATVAWWAWPEGREVRMARRFCRELLEVTQHNPDMTMARMKIGRSVEDLQAECRTAPAKDVLDAWRRFKDGCTGLSTDEPRCAKYRRIP